MVKLWAKESLGRQKSRKKNVMKGDFNTNFLFMFASTTMEKSNDCVEKRRWVGEGCRGNKRKSEELFHKQHIELD